MWLILPSSTPGLYNVYDDDGNPVAMDCTAGRAMIVASAPDLLDACKLTERAWTGDGVDMGMAVDACLLAITKAGG